MGRLRQKEATKRESFLKHAEVRMHVLSQSTCQLTPPGRYPTLCLVLQAPLQEASLGALALICSNLLSALLLSCKYKYCHVSDEQFLAWQGYVPRPVLGALGLLEQPAHCQISVPSSEAGLLAVTLEDIQNVPISAEVLAPANLLFVLSSACASCKNIPADNVL